MSEIYELGMRALIVCRLHAMRVKRKLKLRSVPIDEGFFDLYRRFYVTSETNAKPNRLNQRYRALIESNAAIIKGKSVLDIASHDGRWSFAANKAGARQVLGIEARAHLVNSAQSNMREYQVPEEQFHFVIGDVFEEIDRFEPNTFDTVFCFGFFYHTMHHMLLLSKIARLKPRHVILDTYIDLDPASIIRVTAESVAVEGAGVIPAPGDSAHTVIGAPSKAALELMLSSCGWTSTYYDWHRAGIRRWDDLEDYHEGWRVSLVATSAVPLKVE